MGAPTLRPYQVAMLDAIVASLGAGLRRVLCQASTGTGKTVAFAALLQWPGIATWPVPSMSSAASFSDSLTSELGFTQTISPSAIPIAWSACSKIPTS